MSSFVIRQTQLLQRRGATPAPSAPQISADALTIDEDENGEITIVYNPGNPNPVNWASLSVTVLSGSITANENTDASGSPANGKIQIIPDENWNGAASIEVTVEDDEANASDPLTVNITVESVTDAPVITGTLGAFNEDTTAVLTLGYSSGDNSAANWATLEQVGTNANLTLTMNYLTNGDIRVAPVANYNGSTSFQVRVQDSAGNWSNTLTVNVTVNAVNDAPTLTTDSFLTELNTAYDFYVADIYSDVEGNAANWATLANPSEPTKGTLELNTPSNGYVRYTPTQGEYGADSFTLTVQDSAGATSNEVTIDVTIYAVPVAYNIAVDGWQNNSVDIDLEELVLATDLDGAIDWSTASVTTNPSHGNASITAGVLTFTPATNNATAVTIGWTVEDEDGNESNEATVSVTIVDTWLVQAILALAPYDYRRLNDTSGTFADSSGNSRTAAAKAGGGTIGYNAQTAPDGSPAVGITDASQYIDITDTNSRNVFGGTTWSVLFFFRGNASINWGSADRHFWQFRESSPTNHQHFQKTLITSGNFQTYIQSNGTTDTNQPTAISGDSAWRMGGVAVNQPGNAIAYYLDGAPDGTDTGINAPSLAGTLSLRIGNNSLSCVDTALAHWALFSDVVSDTEIASVWNSGTNRYLYMTLRQLATMNNITVGVAVPNTYASKSAGFKAIVEDEHHTMVDENAIKYSTLYFSGLGSPNWDPLTDVMTAVDAAYMLKHGHCLEWHSDDTQIDNEIADTITAAQDETDRRNAELADKFAAEGWTPMVYIDVCNETLVTSQPGVSTDYLRTTHQHAAKYNNSGTTGTQTSAYEWIKYTFQSARREFPNAYLLLCDFRCEKAGHWKGDALYDLVQRLIDDDIPIDGVGFQGHWQFLSGSSKWVYTPEVVTQIERLKALTPSTTSISPEFIVGWTELDVQMTADDNSTTSVASASSTGSTLVASRSIFHSEMIGWTVKNLTDGTSRTITGYTSATTVTVDSAINDTWDGDDLQLDLRITGTASSSSTGSTLVASSGIFQSWMIGYSVYNVTDGTVRTITGYTSATTVTVDSAINDTWDGDSLLISQDAMWVNLVRNTAQLVDFMNFWSVSDDVSWRGITNNPTLRNEDLSEKSVVNYIRRALWQAAGN